MEYSVINVWTRVLGEYKNCVGLNDRTLALRREGQGFNHRNGLIQNGKYKIKFKEAKTGFNENMLDRLLVSMHL